MKFDNTLEYKGYVGTIEYSEPDEVFHGKVLGIRSLLSYEGETPKELKADFCNMIDDYLQTCKEEGIPVEVPYKGTFNVRLGQELHRDAAIYAINHDQTLNSFVVDAIREKLDREQNGLSEVAEDSTMAQRELIATTA